MKQNQLTYILVTLKLLIIAVILLSPDLNPVNTLILIFLFLLNAHAYERMNCIYKPGKKRED